MQQDEHEEFDILDRNRNKNTGELKSYLVWWKEGPKEGQTELKPATPTNTLLFDYGLYDFISGDEAIIIGDNPEVLVSPTGDSMNVYLLSVDGHMVETTPSQSATVLEGIKDYIEHDDYRTLVELHENIVANQVRRSIINALINVFDKEDRVRIQQEANGWLVDDYFLVNWEASMYAKDDDPEEGDYRRGGGGVVKTDKSHEFVEFRITHEPEPQTVHINGEQYKLTEREMLFLSKVEWLLNREQYHPDEPFWKYMRRFTDRGTKDGEQAKKDFDPSVPGT